MMASESFFSFSLSLPLVPPFFLFLPSLLHFFLSLSVPPFLFVSLAHRSRTFLFPPFLFLTFDCLHGNNVACVVSWYDAGRLSLENLPKLSLTYTRKHTHMHTDTHKWIKD